MTDLAPRFSLLPAQGSLDPRVFGLSCQRLVARRDSEIMEILSFAVKITRAKPQTNGPAGKLRTNFPFAASREKYRRLHSLANDWTALQSRLSISFFFYFDSGCAFALLMIICSMFFLMSSVSCFSPGVKSESFKLVLTFESAYQILKCDHTNESYCAAYHTVQDGSNF